AWGEEHASWRVAESLNNLSGLLIARGSYAQAEPLWRRALIGYENTLGPDHPQTAGCLGLGASLARRQGRYDEAESRARTALAVVERRLGRDHPDLVPLLLERGRIARAGDDLEPAAADLRRAQPLSETRLGGEPPVFPPSLALMAQVLVKQGKSLEAEP